jgi:HAD superfamily hydrolase (TIGR01509 family)
VGEARDAYQAFLLDLDGVLVRTEELHHDAYRRAAQARGFVLPWGFERYCVAAHYGQDRLREELAAELPGLLERAGGWDGFHRDKSRIYLDLLAAGDVGLQPGAAELLRRLAAEGRPRAIVTNATAEQTAMLRRLQPVLEGVPVWVTREDYAAAKPAPDAYLTALDRLGARAAESLGFEDTPRGVQALAAAGVPAVLVTRVTYPRLAATPLLAVPSLADVPEALFARESDAGTRERGPG